MALVLKTKSFQEFLMNSWPAKHYFFLNGWIFRATEGVTYRSNSVIPLNYTGDDVQSDILTIENAYRSFKLPTIFTMFENFQPIDLAICLRKRGYREEDPTDALMISLSKLTIDEELTRYDYEIYKNRIEAFSDFLAKYTKRDKKQQEIIKEISDLIVVPKKCFIIAKDKENILGTLMGVLDPQGYIYIADVFVVPEYRRKKIATSLFYTAVKWALSLEAKYAWLQVEKSNENALKLYYELGMKRVYSYYYLKKDIRDQ